MPGSKGVREMEGRVDEDILRTIIRDIQDL
jgi:hypothetical protein